MTTLKVKNLDEVYSTLRSMAGELTVTGWYASFEGVCFKEADTLLGWFLKNISTLKQGCENLLVAKAYGDGGGYSLYEDRLLISTEKTKLGLLVVVSKEWNDDNGFHDCSGRHQTGSRTQEITFLLKYEES